MHDSTWDRYVRKFQQQPLIPIGASQRRGCACVLSRAAGVAATCVALAGATRRMRAGDRTSFNRSVPSPRQPASHPSLRRWLRFRVIAQGLTVAAAVAGGWQISQERRAARKRGVPPDEEGRAARAAQEKARFDARMEEAVAATAAEEG